MFFNDLKLSRSLRAVTGPIFGKPSKMNCNLSFPVRKIFDARNEASFEDFFARRER